MMTIREYKRVESLEAESEKSEPGDRRYDLAEDEPGQCRNRD